MSPVQPLETRVNDAQSRAPMTDLMPIEEERAVIIRLQQGDRSAFATLYSWYGDLIYRQVIVPRCPNRELAEDCLRDTFRTTLEKIASYEDTNRSIFFWIRRIAANKAIDVHRRYQRDQRLSQAIQNQPSEHRVAHLPAPDRGLEMADTQRQVAQSLSQMNPRYAQALRLRLLEDRSREECAEELGVKLSTFDVLLHRAAKAFRKVWPP